MQGYVNKLENLQRAHSISHSYISYELTHTGNLGFYHKVVNRWARARII